MWESFNFGKINKNICFEMKGFVRAGQRRYGSAHRAKGIGGLLRLKEEANQTSVAT